MNMREGERDKVIISFSFSLIINIYISIYLLSLSIALSFSPSHPFSRAPVPVNTLPDGELICLHIRLYIFRYRHRMCCANTISIIISRFITTLSIFGRNLGLFIYIYMTIYMHMFSIQDECGLRIELIQFIY